MRNDISVNRHYRITLNDNSEIKDKNTALKTCLDEIARINSLDVCLKAVNNVVSTIIGDNRLKFDQTGLSSSFIKSVKFLTANSNVRYGKDVTRGSAILLFACCLRYSQLDGEKSELYKANIQNSYEFISCVLNNAKLKNFSKIPPINSEGSVKNSVNRELLVSTTSSAEATKELAMVLREADIKAVMNFDKSYLDGCHVESGRLVVYKKNGCLSRCLFGDDFHGYNSYRLEQLDRNTSAVFPKKTNIPNKVSNNDGSTNSANAVAAETQKKVEQGVDSTGARREHTSSLPQLIYDAVESNLRVGNFNYSFKHLILIDGKKVEDIIALNDYSGVYLINKNVLGSADDGNSVRSSVIHFAAIRVSGSNREMKAGQFLDYWCLGIMNGGLDYSNIYEFKAYIGKDEFSLPTSVYYQIEERGFADEIHKREIINITNFGSAHYSFKNGEMYENGKNKVSDVKILSSQNLYYAIYLVAKFNRENPSFMENGIYVAFNPDDLPKNLKDWYDKVYKNEPNTSNH